MIITFGIAAVIVAFDLVIKYFAQSMLVGQNITVLAGLLELRLTRNTGMALGFMSGNMVAIIVSPLIVIGLGYMLLRNYERTNYMRVATGMVLGGFLGNFVERVFNGYVIDMIYLPFMPWFICNIADIFICFGVLMVGVSLLLRPQDWREKNAKENSTSEV